MNKYNGWNNRETWLINLWLSNDEGIYNYILELTKFSESTRELAEVIEEFIEENNPLSDHPSLYSDLLTTAINKADYQEIAEHLLED